MLIKLKNKKGEIKMQFKDLKKALQDKFKQMTEGLSHLYEVAVDKDELWNLYLDSFPAGTNEIFRERREYDCSCCRQFVKNIGNAVVISNNKIKTIWDLYIYTVKEIKHAKNEVWKNQCFECKY